jgi:hypothetical protein
MRRTTAALVLLAAAGPAAAADYPHVYLKNEKLKVKVYLPDAEKGFYRGTRFDWAGVFGEVEFAGHKVFGPWKDTHDPTNHDDIVGPCEEFGNQAPLGYADAKPGGTFLKIGVGELEKPDDKPYSFARKYRIVKPAGWKEAHRDPDGKAGKIDVPSIRWEMTASLPTGYAYQYEKNVRLLPARALAAVEIVHVLRNKGTKPIVTDVYNHNFFNVDGDPVGPNYRIAFRFDAKAQNLRGRFGELVDLSDKELKFKKPLADGFVMAELTGYNRAVGPPEFQTPEHKTFEFHHQPSQVRVRVHNSEPYAKFNVWGVKTTICPEPYARIEVKPGQDLLWNISYAFEHGPPKE